MRHLFQDSEPHANNVEGAPGTPKPDIGPELFEDGPAMAQDNIDFDDLPDELLAGAKVEALAKKAPLVYGQLCDEAQEDETTPAEYINSLTNGFIEWFVDLKHWCTKELKRYETRERIPPILHLAQEKETAHTGMELMNRYQGAIDNELYRAMDALRKQQDWRQKNGIDLEVEAEVA